MYILKIFLKRHNFARLIFVFKKFQEVGTESSYFPIQTIADAANLRFILNHPLREWLTGKN